MLIYFLKYITYTLGRQILIWFKIYFLKICFMFLNCIQQLWPLFIMFRCFFREKSPNKKVDTFATVFTPESDIYFCPEMNLGRFQILRWLPNE